MLSSSPYALELTASSPLPSSSSSSAAAADDYDYFVPMVVDNGVDENYALSVVEGNDDDDVYYL